jgi:hypothetical protein
MRGKDQKSLESLQKNFQAFTPILYKTYCGTGREFTGCMGRLLGSYKTIVVDKKEQGNFLFCDKP